MTQIPPLPAGFTLDSSGIPPLPAGFTLDGQQSQSAFSSRLQADFQKRKDAMKQSAEDYVGGKQGLASTYLQTAGNIAAVPVDAIMETIGSGYNALPDAIKPRLTEQGRAALDTVKQGIGSAVDYVSDSAVGDVARQNPVLMKNVAALGNIASVVPVVGATKIVGMPIAEAAGKGISKIPSIASSAVEKLATPKQVIPNSEQLAEMGVKAYDAARTSGEVFDNKVSSEFISAIERAKPKNIAGVVETDLSQALESSLGKYRNIAGKPLSIDEVDIIDKDLSNLKDQAYSAGKNQLGSELANIQNALRGSIAEAPSGQTLAQARNFYRKKYQMEDVERIFRNAEGRPNEAAIIQTGYRNLANQARKKGSGYTKEQIALMDKAAKGGLSIDALKLLSSRLIPIAAGATSGGLGAGAAFMGNLAAGAGATALQTAKANKLAESIVRDLRVSAEPTLINKTAAKLTKKDLQDAFEAKKAAKTEPKMLTYQPQQTDILAGNAGARQLTPEEQIAVAAQRENAASIASRVALTPEQRAIAAKIQVPVAAQAFERPILNDSAKNLNQKAKADAEFNAKKTQAKQNRGFAESGKPTSLATFIRKNDGLKDDGGDLRAMGYRTLINPYGKGMSIDDLGEELWQQGFFPERPTANQVLDLIAETKGGKNSYAPKDIARVNKAQEKAAAAGQNDPSYVEFSADQLGIDTANKTTNQLIKEINEKMRGFQSPQ